MTIAVTGGTGFVGQALLDLATGQGIKVRALTRRDQPDRDGITWVRGNLATPEALERLVQGADAVIHIAGVINAPGVAGFREGNVAGTQAVVDAAQKAGVRRFVHVSSLAAREPQLSDYGASKHGAEEVVTASGLEWTIVRPPAVYGPRDAEIFELFKMARFGVVAMPPAGRASIIHVNDLARLLLILAKVDAGDAPPIMEPDDGRDGGWSHKALAKCIGKAVGKSVWAPNVPRPIFMAAARLDRLFRGANAKFTPDRASYMAHPDWVSDPVKAVPATLWQPEIYTEQGISATAAWYRANAWL